MNPSKLYCRSANIRLKGPSPNGYFLIRETSLSYLYELDLEGSGER